MRKKICNKCKKKKSINEFHKDERTEDKLSRKCEKCWKQDRKEKRKEYYRENKEMFRRIYKKHYKKSKEKILKKAKKYRNKNPIGYWCNQVRNSHKRKGFKILFTFEELASMAKKTKNCHLCGTKLDWKYGRGRKDNNPSLDRINNENFLILSNIQIVCCRCNATKYNRTMKEFIDYCKEIYFKFR
ncbi:hypothetical protein ES703_118714 [subsurface metagenome]